jgi:hypothetical protein
MARIGIHHDAHTTPTWAAKSLRTGRRIARALSNLEGAAERHWPFATYAVLSITTAVYVAAQMARL